MSCIFSDSFSFKPTPIETPSGQVALESMTIYGTYTRVKTVVYSNHFISTLYTVCYSNSECVVFSYYTTFLPYVIYTMIPTYLYSPVLVFMEVKKRRLSDIQLIGVVCGSVAVFFCILGIIVIVVKKNNTNHYYEDVSENSSSFETDDFSDDKNMQVEVNVSFKSTEGNNMDNWI